MLVDTLRLTNRSKVYSAQTAARCTSSWLNIIMNQIIVQQVPRSEHACQSRCTFTPEALGTGLQIQRWTLTKLSWPQKNLNHQHITYKSTADHHGPKPVEYESPPTPAIAEGLQKDEEKLNYKHRNPSNRSVEACKLKWTKTLALNSASKTLEWSLSMQHGSPAHVWITNQSTV